MHERRACRFLAARTVVVAALVWHLAAGGAVAAEKSLRLDPAKAKVEFFLGTPLHDVEGSFALRSGEVRFDPATGAASGEVVVDLTGARTGNGSRDKTMHEEVLESKRFPLATWRFEKVEGTLPASGAGTVKLVGTLDFHGAPHPLALPATVEVDGSRLRGKTEMSIPFLDWGLHDPSLFFLRVERVVRVTIALEGELVETP